MKVSIITRHAIPNYGSILQSYATQKTFENLGYDAEILNYVRYDERGKESVISNCHIPDSGLKNKIKRFIYFWLQYPNSQKMNNTFKKFQKQYLRLSNTTYGNVDELKKDLPKADIFVTGSDQVWGKIGPVEYDPAYFLSFVPEDKKQIAYSASFGKTELNDNLTSQLDKLLSQYSSILVREKSAVDIIEEYTDKSAKHILDPTLMLDKEEWEKLCEPTGLEGKDYIFVYQLHHNKDMEEYIRRIQKETGLPVYRAHPSIFYGLKPGRFVHLPTPGQFLSYIKNAKYMVTDSFHGTVFSIIFNKQFIDIVPELTGTRIYSLLDLIGQSERILKDLNDFSWMNHDIDYSIVNEIIGIEKKKTLDALTESLGKKNKTIDSMNQHKECCGCSACMEMCPTNAIYMTFDEDGFVIPKVNHKLCVNCGICLMKCPQNNEVKKMTYKQKGYAAKMKNKEELLKSASGGIFYQCAKMVLDNEGVVYGAALLDDMSVEHKRIDHILYLNKLQGSKYVQSHMNDTYKKVKEDLEEGTLVLFSGTPCQVNGLYASLKKSYSNLLTIDIICHGVPSQKLLKKSISYDEDRKNSPMTSYEFRNKEKRGWDKNYKKTYKNGQVDYGNGLLDVYYKAFLNGDIYRECCYDCYYASMDRVGDITIGDFWGIDRELPHFSSYDGVSCIIVNSEKGNILIDEIKDDLIYEEVELEKIVKHNQNLTDPTERSVKRNSMYLNIDTVEFDKMDIYKSHKMQPKHIISYLMPTDMKLKIKRLLRGK